MRISVLIFNLFLVLNVNSGSGNMMPGIPGDEINSEENAITSQTYRQYRFKNITVKDGLSFYRTRGITQDRFGFMWLGADNGLDRFDGKNITSFKQDESDPGSIPHNEVSFLLNNPGKDRIWIGTRGGLCYIDIKTFEITRIDLGPNNDIRTIAEAHGQGLWVGTQNGLLYFDETTLDYTVFNTSNSNLSHNQVRSIYEDRSGNLWVGTLDKLNLLKQDSNEFKTFDLRGDYEHLIQNNLILAITPRFKNSDSLLWIGTETGLCLFNRHTEEFKLYRKSSGINLSNDKIAAIYRADSNRIWLGTDFGLNLFDIKNGRSEVFYHNPTDPGSLSNNKIWSIYEDRAGIIWFATDNGVNLLDKNQKAFIYYPVNYEFEGQSVGIQINDIIPDESEGYWLATQQGIIRYSTSRGITSTFRHQPNDPLSLLAARTKDLYIDEFEKLWIATNKGINAWDPGRSRMYSFPANFGPGSGLKSQFTNSLVRAHDHSFWVGTWDGGLHKVTGDLDDINSINFIQVNALSTGGFVSGPKALWIYANSELNRMDLLTNQWTTVEATKELLHGRNVHSMHYSNKGSLWLGTGNGLIEYVIHNEQALFHPIKSGRNLNIISILEDHLGNIWCCSLTSLIKFAIADRQFEVYPVEKGIPTLGFLPRSCCNTKKGNLVFAGQDGFIVFDPDKITKSNYQPDIVIGELFVQNERVIPGREINGNMIIENSISFENEITLDYNQRSLMFSFASLHYGDPSGNIFAYRLEGFDPEWIYTSGDQNSAIYSNLPSGKYTLMLRGTNNDGVWSQNETALSIKIKPPPMASPGFILIYILVLLILLSLIFYIYQMKIKWLNKLQNIKTEKDQNEKLSQLKQRFFTNISHEFRTPLSLILGPTNEILKKDAIGRENRKLLELISKNAQRLLRLVNQFIDFRKLEVGSVKLHESNHEIIGFCYQIYDLFTGRAERKCIEYSFHSNTDELLTSFDSGQMETILYNLLSNAFNFTPKGGKISVEVNVHTEENGNFPAGSFCIRIKDSGIGISKQDQSRIFDRFYQSEDEKGMVKGSGIGLTLVKEYVEMHSGSISVESSPGAGSVFDISIPVKMGEPEAGTSTGYQTDNEPATAGADDYHAIAESGAQQAYPDRPLILLVEDDPDVINFIKTSLGGKYEYVAAENGKLALQLVEQQNPDLIVSDVMMPEMDGYTLSKNIKDNPRTSHIPVILLSARTFTDHQIEGIKSGADAYLTKPFDTKYLGAVIENLFTRKELLVEYVRMQTILNPSEIEITSGDEKILKQIITFIESHISDPELSVKKICQATGFTHSFLYRKIKHMTGGTLNELIRDIRIKRAAQLLKSRKFTVAEVMVEVGFSNHSYFSKCFRKVYRKSPRSYIANHGN